MQYFVFVLNIVGVNTKFLISVSTPEICLNYFSICKPKNPD